MMNDSGVSRNELLTRLQGLLAAQFEEVIFHCDVPDSWISSPAAEQSTRAIQLIRYFEQQDRLAVLAGIVSQSREAAVARKNEPVVPPPAGTPTQFVGTTSPLSTPPSIS